MPDRVDRGAIWTGGLKAFRYDADGIVPFVANSPFMGFLYADPENYAVHKNPEGALVPARLVVKDIIMMGAALVTMADSARAFLRKRSVGIVLTAWLAVLSGIATKPDAYSWRQMCGAGALGGIGFTMSLFIAGVAFADQADYAAAKIAIFLASLAAGALGVLVLWPKLSVHPISDRLYNGPRQL
jgi:hypothetical protein